MECILCLWLEPFERTHHHTIWIGTQNSWVLRMCIVIAVQKILAYRFR